MVISNKKALEAAKTIIDFCKEQRGCQNCIFRKHGADHWECNIEGIEGIDVNEVMGNYEA